MSQNELSTDSEQAVSSKNLKVRAHQFFFRTRSKNIHFHAIRFVQNTARNAALTNMCVLVPPRKIFIIQSGDLSLCRNWKTIEGDSLLRISAQFVLGHSVYRSPGRLAGRIRRHRRAHGQRQAGEQAGGQRCAHYG